MKKEYKLDLAFYNNDIFKKVVDMFNDIAHVEYENGLLKIEGSSLNEIDEIYREFLNFYIYVFNTDL